MQTGKQVLVIDLSVDEADEAVHFLGQDVQLMRRGCGGDVVRARELIAAHDGKVDAIALDGLPERLQLGRTQVAHEHGATLSGAADTTPVVDGDGIRAGLERWGVILGDRAEPGVFSQKRVLMVPGLNHGGLAQALERRGSAVRYADPFVYFGLPNFPGVGSRQTLDQAAPATLQRLRDEPFRRIFPQPGTPRSTRPADPFQWADIVAGDVGAIRRYAPSKLAHKTVVV